MSEKPKTLKDELLDIVIEAQITEDTTQAIKRIGKTIDGLVAELQKRRDNAQRNWEEYGNELAHNIYDIYVDILKLLGAKKDE